MQPCCASSSPALWSLITFAERAKTVGPLPETSAANPFCNNCSLINNTSFSGKTGAPDRYAEEGATLRKINPGRQRFPLYHSPGVSSAGILSILRHYKLWRPKGLSFQTTSMLWPAEGGRGLTNSPRPRQKRCRHK